MGVRDEVLWRGRRGGGGAGKRSGVSQLAKYARVTIAKTKMAGLVPGATRWMGMIKGCVKMRTRSVFSVHASGAGISRQNSAGTHSGSS